MRTLKEQSDAGWTFMETLIVISIILILTGTVGFMGLKYVEQSRAAAARSGLRALALALDCYRIDCGDYPTADQGLGALLDKPYLDPVPEDWNGPYLAGRGLTDPWNRPWLYSRPGPSGYPYDLASRGADGVAGGAGHDADLSLRD